ncbi:unnamed protein product [Macrosiphum euphorbiae]|uniref:DUF5641 domain-containing protein n=1 Tax=Macrosiphum euphorbiae TaxID=13131 RepID=A0AAV0WT32_9HEMI|nr:unnamed protein product [Macrosiphum euphorbiae]
MQAQSFWKRWSGEYLPQLPKRGCWLSKNDNVKVGSLAILKEENIPSLKWKMVRITKVHPGDDGIVRVVTITNYFKGGECWSQYGNFHVYSFMYLCCCVP